MCRGRNDGFGYSGSKILVLCLSTKEGILKKKTVAELRKKAEKKLEDNPNFSPDLEDKDPKRLIHELKTYQIELEIQNETLREAQLDLETSRRKYATLFEAAPVGYFALDNHGIVREVNDEGKRLLELDKGGIIGKVFSAFIAGREGLEAFLKSRNSARLRHVPQTFDIRMKRKNGPNFHAQVTITGLKQSGDLNCLVGVSDVTAPKEAEKEKERYFQEMETLNDTVGRYLRSPVITLLGFLRAFLEDNSKDLDESGREHLARALKNAETLKRNLENLVDFTEMSLRKMDKDILELKSVAKSVVRDLTDSSSDNLRVEVGLLPSSCADTAMIRKVFECMISNAIKSTSGKKDPSIAVGGYLRDSENVYYVKDNGIGFDPRYSDKLFLPFQKLHPDEQFPGTGIGLAIVKKIVGRHGGRVWAEANKEEGATFYFSLPVKGRTECGG